MKIIKIIAGIIILLAVLIFILLRTNLYLAAFSSKWFITNTQFNKIVASSLTYYQKSFSGYATSTLLNDANFQQEIKRAALDKLIEDKIIDEILIKKLGSQELKKLVNDKLANLTINSEVANASQLLYNLSLEDFKKLVLAPQAKREILKEQGIGLQEIKKSHHPIILVPGFYWQNEVLSRS